MDKKKAKGAKPKVSSSRQCKTKPKAKTSQPKPSPKNGNIQTKADIDTKTSYEDALPSGYWGPCGKPMSTSKRDVAARPQPSSKPVPNDRVSNKSRERSVRSHICDVSDYPELRSGMTTPKTRTQGPARKLVQKYSSESVERKPSLKVKFPTKPKCHDQLGKNPDKTDKANKFLLDVLRNNVLLKIDDISKNTNILDRLKVFLDDVRNLDPTFPLSRTGESLIPTGSYYEKLKVCRPNEFDVMIVLDVKPSMFQLEWERDQRMEGYVKLKMAMQESRWSVFMTDDGNYLSPIKIRKRFFELLQKVTKSSGELKVKVEEHGPAVQLTFNRHGEVIAEADMVLCVAFPEAWPQHAIVEKHGLSPALLGTVKGKGFHVVPKTFAESDVKNWRVSFSVGEKYLLLYGEIEREAKNVLKFVKFLREKHERLLPGINSYHLKNIFLELAFVTKTASTKLANKDNFTASVIDILSALLDALKRGKLCHFFNSRCNLLLQLCSTDKELSYKTIEWMLTLLRSNDERKIKEMIPSF